MRLLEITWNIWLQLSPWMLLGAFVAGLMHVLIPDGWIKRQLSGRMGVLKAVVIGVPLPLCSCGVIPVGLGLRKTGAGHGATVGFLISTPQTGVDSVLVSAAFLGWPFALLKVVVAFVTGIVGGWFADAQETNDAAESTTDIESSCCAEESHAEAGAGGVFAHGMQLIRSIWKWLLAGVLVSALLTWWNPSALLANQSLLTGLPALLMTLLIALPLYVCATAAVPIAAALVASGFPPGAALVFLMAGPATNIATLGAIYRALGRSSLVVYLATIVAGSLAAGVLFNSFITADLSQMHHHEHAQPWWAALSGVVLAGVVAWLAVEELRSRNGSSGESESSPGEGPVLVQLGMPTPVERGDS